MAEFEKWPEKRESRFPCPLASRGCPSTGFTAKRDLARHLFGRADRKANCVALFSVPPITGPVSATNLQQKRSVSSPGTVLAKKPKVVVANVRVPPTPLPLTANPVPTMEMPLKGERENWEVVQILQKKDNGYLVAWRRTLEYVDSVKSGKATKCGSSWKDEATGRDVAEFEWPASWNKPGDGMEIAIAEFEERILNLKVVEQETGDARADGQSDVASIATASPKTTLSKPLNFPKKRMHESPAVFGTEDEILVMRRKEHDLRIKVLAKQLQTQQASMDMSMEVHEMTLQAKQAERSYWQERARREFPDRGAGHLPRSNCQNSPHAGSYSSADPSFQLKLL